MTHIANEPIGNELSSSYEKSNMFAFRTSVICYYYFVGLSVLEYLWIYITFTNEVMYLLL